MSGDWRLSLNSQCQKFWRARGMFVFESIVLGQNSSDFNDLSGKMTGRSRSSILESHKSGGRDLMERQRFKHDERSWRMGDFNNSRWGFEGKTVTKQSQGYTKVATLEALKILEGFTNSRSGGRITKEIASQVLGTRR
jgi:hypothetical protein